MSGARITGLAELLKTFQELKAPNTLEEIAYKATFGSAKDLKALTITSAQSRVHDPSGVLIPNIAIKKIHPGQTQLGYTVGVRANQRKRPKKKGTRGKGSSGGDVAEKKAANNPFYWWFLEFGTAHMGPRGFFQAAISQWQPAAVATIQKIGLAAVLKAANTAARKIGKGTKKAV